MKPLLLTLLSVLIYLHGSAQPTTIPDDRWALVGTYLQQQNDFSGIITLAAGGKIRFQQGYGFAVREQKVPFTASTLYTVGSITKPFTATAVLLLFEAGKLRLEDTLAKYFQEAPADKKSITLHQLLTHSAGFPGGIGDDYEAISKEEFIKRAWQTPLAFTPGTGYEYSNVGYSLLCMIVEQVSGMGYDAFLQKNVFGPAGMKTAGYTNPAADYTRLVHGYRADGQDWGTSKSKTWNGAEPYWHLKGNGGLLMSADDLFHWYLALRGNKVLKPETLKMQTTPYVDEGGGSHYGYGYAILGNGNSVQHNGGNGIFRADFRWYPALDFCLMAASNDARVRLFRLDDEIIQILLTGELPGQMNWQKVPMGQFPSNRQQEVAKAMLGVLADYSPQKATEFVEKNYSAGIIQRNTRERLIDMLKILSRDSGGNSAEAVLESNNRLQLVVPAAEQGAKIKISLTFLDGRIDKLQAEMEGQ